MLPKHEVCVIRRFYPPRSPQGRRRKMGDLGRKTVMEYDIMKVVRRYIEVFEKMTTHPTLANPSPTIDLAPQKYLDIVYAIADETLKNIIDTNAPMLIPSIKEILLGLRRIPDPLRSDLLPYCYSLAKEFCDP